MNCGSVHLPVQTPPAPILKAHERVSETQPRFHVPPGRVLLGSPLPGAAAAAAAWVPRRVRAGLGLSRRPVRTSAGRPGSRPAWRRGRTGLPGRPAQGAPVPRLLSGWGSRARDGAAATGVGVLSLDPGGQVPGSGGRAGQLRGARRAEAGAGLRSGWAGPWGACPDGRRPMSRCSRTPPPRPRTVSHPPHTRTPGRGAAGHA